jgi:hypothetical protein
MFKLNSVFLLAVAWSLLTVGAHGLAQQPVKSQSDSQQGVISDGDLRAFVKAYVENQKIREKYEPPLSAMTDPEKYKQMQDQASGELQSSLAKQKLSIEKYNRIYNAINSDEQLRERTLRLVEEERQRS